MLFCSQKYACDSLITPPEKPGEADLAVPLAEQLEARLAEGLEDAVHRVLHLPLGHALPPALFFVHGIGVVEHEFLAVEGVAREDLLRRVVRLDLQLGKQLRL